MFTRKSFVQPEIRVKHGRTAIVNFDGQQYALGVWDGVGTPPAPVMAAYLRLLPLLEEKWKAKRVGAPQPEDASAIPVAQVVDLYLDHLARDEDGDRRPDGSLSSHYERAVTHLRPLVALYASSPARAITSKDLKVIRSAVRQPEPAWHLAVPNFFDPLPGGRRRRKPKQWSPWYANNAVQNIIGCFAWAESEGIVPAGITEHLRTLRPLRCQPAATATIPDEHWEIACRYTSPQVAAMIRLQRITAMRPGELVRMRPCDIDASGDVWVYRPRDEQGRHKHKTDRFGIERLIPLSAACQAILAPLLAGRPERTYLFSPAEAAQWWREHPDQRSRKTPVYPSELEARRKRKLAAQKRPKRKQPGSHYTQYSYRQAIRHALARARRAGEDVPDWTPYALRHTRITEVEREHGWDAAQAVAGHESLNTTRRYAHERHLRALDLAARDGGRGRGAGDGAE